MLVGAMKKLIPLFVPLFVLPLASCSGAASEDVAAPMTTVAASQTSSESAQTSAAPSSEPTKESEKPSSSATPAPRDTTFKKIFGEKADANAARGYLEENGHFDRALMKDSLTAAGLNISDSEVTEYGQWVCEWVDPEIRYTVVMEGDGRSLTGDKRFIYDKLIVDTVEWLPGNRGITISPEQVEKALPQAVLTSCLDERSAQEILHKPNWF